MWIAIDSSQASCSLALFNGETLVAERTEPRPGKQVEQLLPLWQELLDEHNIPLKQLEKIIVSLGPGSFAGTRIALAVAKAVTLHTHIPLIGLTTLEMLGFTTPQADTALIDAKRDSWYLQRFNTGISTSEPILVTNDRLEHHMGDTRVVSAPNIDYVFTAIQATIDAKTLGLAHIANPEAQNALIPCYVRTPDAKLPTAIPF